MVGRGLPAESKQGIQRAALELHEQQPVSVAQAYVLRAGKGGNHHWTEVFGQTETSHGGDGRNESARPGTEQGRQAKAAATATALAFTGTSARANAEPAGPGPGRRVPEGYGCKWRHIRIFLVNPNKLFLKLSYQF
jgi:hypothetical protein